MLSLLHANHVMGMHMALSQDLQNLNVQGMWKAPMGHVGQQLKQHVPPV